MPDTTTATWPSLIAGRKARASEVEAKFDWAEANLWPHSAGVTADATYDLGKSTARWKNGWFSGGFNPTSTAAGLAIGKDSANANTSFDLSAMPKAFYLPILTTTQRNALTPSAGFIIYNNTSSRIERYEGGQWLAMNNPMGVIDVVSSSTTYSAGVTTLAFSLAGGSGRIKQMLIGRPAAASGSLQLYMKFDSGTALYGAQVWSNTAKYVLPFIATGTSLEFTTTVMDLDLYFKNSIDIYININGATQTANYILLYEKA